MSNIKIIIDKDLKNYGFLKSIPLIKERYGVENFTFMAQFYFISKNLKNPIFFLKPFKINFVLLNSPEIKNNIKDLNNICQIITQAQEFESTFDITKYLINYTRDNSNFQLYIITDTMNFKLKKNSIKSRGDRSIMDNFNIQSIEYYDSILNKYLRENKIENLDKYLHFTKNLYFLRIAKLYEDIYGKLKKFEDLFNFRHIREISEINNSKYVLWKFVFLILEGINKNRFNDDFQLDYFLDKVIKPFIEIDKLRIKNHLDSYFQSIKNNITTFKNEFGAL